MNKQDEDNCWYPFFFSFLEADWRNSGLVKFNTKNYYGTRGSFVLDGTLVRVRFKKILRTCTLASVIEVYLLKLPKLNQWEDKITVQVASVINGNVTIQVSKWAIIDQLTLCH